MPFGSENAASAGNDVQSMRRSFARQTVISPSMIASGSVNLGGLPPTRPTLANTLHEYGQGFRPSAVPR
jgi:hypothetical protein